MKTTRRRFIKTSGTALASTALLSQIPLNLLTSCIRESGISFGFQVWTIKDKLIEDFVGLAPRHRALSGELTYSEC